MHKYFPDWYREAALNPTSEIIEHRNYLGNRHFLKIMKRVTAQFLESELDLLI